MKNNITKAELINTILEQESILDLEDEEIMHILVRQRVSTDTSNMKADLAFGDKMADSLARFAGSWIFIIIFILILGSWILYNTISKGNSFDPYPFILLNLVLSCIAAIQAPVIMMSQNRQEEKDRIRARNDYEVNLKSELIVEDLHYKIDEIMKNQELIMKTLSIMEEEQNEI